MAERSVQADYPWLIDDPDLIHRGNPAWPEHDRNGFRNRRVPSRADVVVIGDSQTYGMAVARDEAWPLLLGAHGGRTVYNAGMGGWGSMQYGLVVEELLSLRPDQILVAVYTGNDVYEAYFDTRASRSALAQSWWRPGYAGLPWIDSGHRHVKARRLAELTKGRGLSRIEALELCARDAVPDCNRITLGGVRLVLEDRYRRNNQDLAEPVIQAGLEISERAIRHLRDVTSAFGVELTVVLIPTREYVVYRRLDDLDSIDDADSLRRLGETEARLLERLRAACAGLDVACIDLSGVLAASLERGIYVQDSDDGHPSPEGCRVIATRLAHFLPPPMRGRSQIYPLY